MSKPMCITLIALVMVLLVACGGRPDEAAAPADPHAAVPGAPDRGVQAAPAAAVATPVDTLAASEGLASLKQQVAMLRRDVDALRLQLAGAPSSTRPADLVADPRSDPQARFEAEQVERQRVASAESAFRSEREDLRWSLGAAANMRALLAAADEPVRSQVRSVECRSQTCRVEIGADARAQTAPELPLVLARLGQALPKVTAGLIDQGDGRQATVLYLSR